ncbi:hypothetical protein IE53DRAFT_18607 [Violaceomyces palustris]|uniref:Uncharacterized protein n=1 Tax=Violaceomyces palustris TaxID=1673888 RepID=A0ACD0NLI5_9BASI|nr:hypothetical protein IE53DRAFT_18607 [Violaceomyces palustris]
MRSTLFGALSAGLTLLSTVASLPPLERNLAYRSPSLTVGSNGLSHDIDAIGRSIRKRASVARRTLKGPKFANQADSIEANYDGDYGSDGRMAYKGNLTFPYSVASGDPYDTSAILWTHPVPTQETSDPICLRYQTSKSRDFSKADIADSSYAWTTSDVDYSYKVETVGLEPLTQYYYRFSACHDESIRSPVGRFKTMPKPDDAKVDSLKIAVFSCSNFPFGFFNAYSQASRKDIDYAMHVGDYIYESTGDGSPDSYGDGRPLDRVPEPNKEIFTLSDYRQRYATYRGRDEGLKALHANKSWLLVWDDHEVADNSYNHGTADSNNTASGTYDGVTFTDRKRNAVKAYYEWMPIRQVDTTDSLRIWRKFQYGKLADLFLLDTRNYDRDVTDVYYNTAEIAAMSNDTNRSLMGGKQEKWFYKNLVEAQERGSIWKVVGQQIIVNHLHEGSASYPFDYDAWDGYKANRRRMFKTITENKVDNTIFLAGDSHAAWAYDAIPEENENSTSLYDPSTGKGALGVEFAGTAVSSPSSYGANLTLEQYTKRSEIAVTINRNLQFAEGAHRGYFELDLTRESANAHFYGIVNNTDPHSQEILLASFNVKKGANRITRPLNGGKKAKSGALQSSVVDYSKQKWNGTAFA